MFIFSSSTYLVFIIWCMSSLLSTHNIQHYKRIQQNPNPIWPRIGKKPFAYKWEKGFPMSNGCFDFFPAKIHFAAFTMSWNKFWRIILIYIYDCFNHKFTNYHIYDTMNNTKLMKKIWKNITGFEEECFFINYFSPVWLPNHFLFVVKWLLNTTPNTNLLSKAISFIA